MLNININDIHKNQLELLDCQVEIILYSLELFSTNLRFIYPKSNKHLTNTEELKISLVTDTYEQILSQFNSSKNCNKKVFEKNLKKFA